MAIHRLPLGSVLFGIVVATAAGPAGAATPCPRAIGKAASEFNKGLKGTDDNSDPHSTSP